MKDKCPKPTKPLPKAIFMDNIYIYEYENMYVTITKSKFDIQTGGHAHDGYEFIIPLMHMPYLEIGDEVFSGNRGEMLPINPWQRHGVSQTMKEVNFVDIVIDSNYVREVFEAFGYIKTPTLKNQIYKLDFETQHNIRKFIEEIKGERLGREVMLQSICCQFAVELLRQTCDDILSHKKVQKAGNEKRIAAVIQFINDRFNEDCSLERLSDIACMSRYHFIRSFRDIIGKSPYDYLIDFRISKAKELLRNSEMRITSIVTICGFNDTSHFSKVFKSRVGCTPSKYRDKVNLKHINVT